MATTHARFSPSMLEGLEQCPCFAYAEMDIKEGEETPAERGTRLHSLVETGSPEFIVDEQEDNDLYEKTKMFLDGLKASFENKFTELTELRVEVKDLTYGTADKVIVNAEGKKAKLVDWKFIRGASVSVPSDNLQLQAYTAGLLELFPKLEEVEAYIVAPQINWIPDPHTYTRNDLATIRARIQAVIEKCADPFKKPTPCDLCQKCANAARCPALGNAAVVVAGNIGLPMPSTFAPDSLASPEDRAKAYIIAKALGNWGEQVTKNVNEWLKQGNELPGHSTVTRKGSLKVIDVEAAVAAMRVMLDDSQILKAMNISLSKLTDIVAEKEGKKRARETVEDLLVGLTTRGPDVVYALRRKGDSSV